MFKLTIDTTNAAFDIDATYELARILRELSEELQRGNIPNRVYDFNGNRVGTLECE